MNLYDFIVEIRCNINSEFGEAIRQILENKIDS